MIEKALEALKKGKIILVFDSNNRERETDMIMAAEFVKSKDLTRIRKDAGGLVCVPISSENSDKLRIPFMNDILEYCGDKYPLLKELSPNDIPYDEKSAFSITLNHRKTFTGITDDDRALTIKELGNLCKNGEQSKLGEYFRAPGHVTLLRAAKDHVLKRQGHTEMSIALMEMAGLTEVAICCEMMDDNGESLNHAKAEEYAKNHDHIFLNGDDIIAAYKEYKN